MKLKVSITAAALLLAATIGARAQYSADLIGGYNFSSDTRRAGFCLQTYGQDRFGDTYARADFDFAADHLSLGSASLELARTLVFWKGTPVQDLGLHVEFDGFLNMGSCNWLFGLDYTLPFNDLVKVALSYRLSTGNTSTYVPVQLSLLWDIDDMADIRGLEFRGTAKIWGETTTYWYGDKDPKEADAAYFTVKATPQLWYAVGQFFGWDGLSLGGELEIGYSYLGCSGFRVRPFAGLRVSF